MINVGDVIRLENGQHAVVVRHRRGAQDDLYCECLTGDGIVVSRREDAITEKDKTRYKLSIDNILGALKVYDRQVR